MTRHPAAIRVVSPLSAPDQKEDTLVGREEGVLLLAGTGSASRPRWTVLLDQAEVVREERADRALRGQEEGVLLRRDRGMGAAGRRDVPWLVKDVYGRNS